jgi:hypothetical protein
MMNRRGYLGVVALSLLVGEACGDNEKGGSGLGPFLPPIPPATGEQQNVFAGEITQATPNEILKGPAAAGMMGDFFIRNDKVSFVVQSPTRVIGLVPQGGNLVDAVLNDGTTKQIVEDHFGEFGLIYLLGRTCEHDTIEIVRDGSAGGVAVIHATGKSGNDDFLNIKAIGILPVRDEIDPDVPDELQCATTYILQPGANTLQVHHTVYNAGAANITGPFGSLADTGGVTEVWGNGRGFERIGLDSLTALSDPQPIDYTVYQGPDVAYGIVPRHLQPTLATAVRIAGVSLFLLGNDSLFANLNADDYYLKLAPGAGFNQPYDIVVGRDAADVDAVFRGATATVAVSGSVKLSSGMPALGARVGIYLDSNSNGAIDDEDSIVNYTDAATDGTFRANVAPGNHLVRAEVKNVGRSNIMPAATSLTLAIPAPLTVNYTIVDDETNMPIPGRLLVIGDHPAFPDKRLFETADRVSGVVTVQHSTGQSSDPALRLPAGGTLRIYASRGTEYSIDSKPVTSAMQQTLQFRLRRVAPASGYLATEWHVHQVGSPDSTVGSDERIRSAVAAGIEMFAVTDHDFVSNLQPLVQEMGLDSLVRVLPGIEVTPFAYGHYNAWPMNVDDSDASGGAVDWARGDNGFGMLPSQVYADMKARGAKMQQVNHPRSQGLFQAAFERAQVKYDYTNRTIFGDFGASDVPNAWLRLPDQTLWSDAFNGLEVWNGFAMADTNDDGIREITSLDRVMSDWFNMLSLGFYVSPAGNSDTHYSLRESMGMPRTYVRVPNDSGASLRDGSSIDEVLSATSRKSPTGAAVPGDIVVSNGPMIEVTQNGQPIIGRVASAVGGATFVVKLTAAQWAEFDTLEVFANSTQIPLGRDTSLRPLKCWTVRPLASLSAKDPCKEASLAPESMQIRLVNAGGGVNRYEATVTVTIDDADIENRSGATGKDAWLVFRVRGNRAIFPLLTDGVLTPELMPVALSGNPVMISAAHQGVGVSASAFTAPIFVDFDGGGYRAPFAPQ